MGVAEILAQIDHEIEQLQKARALLTRRRTGGPKRRPAPPKNQQRSEPHAGGKTAHCGSSQAALGRTEEDASPETIGEIVSVLNREGCLSGSPLSSPGKICAAAMDPVSPSGCEDPLCHPSRYRGFSFMAADFACLDAEVVEATSARASRHIDRASSFPTPADNAAH